VHFILPVCGFWRSVVFVAKGAPDKRREKALKNKGKLFKRSGGDRSEEVFLPDWAILACLNALLTINAQCYSQF